MVPKVAYDLPEFKIRPKDQIGTIHTWSINHMCITIFAQKMSVESWKSYIVGENVAGIFNFGVSTLSQISTQVMVIMAIITEKSAKILRILVGKKLVVLKFFSPIVMVNVPIKRSKVAKKTFGI